MVTEVVDYVVGVDTHRDEHTLAVVEARTGAVVAQRRVATTRPGYAQALRFAQQHADAARVWAVEGTGHYGAGLARHLSERGETVLEVARSPRSERRLRGKDDQLDAVRAARAALTSEPLPRPRAGERREALRLLLVARRSAVDVRREALVQLRSVLVTAPEHLRDELRGLPVKRLLERCSHLRRSPSATPDELAARLVLRTLPRRSRLRASSRRARARDPRTRPGARTAATRRAGCWSDRRRPTPRRLVTPRPRPLRGCLRPARRRRTASRLEWPDQPVPAQPRRRSPTQPGTPHDRPPPPTARPGDQGLHRQADRRRQEPPRCRPTAQALPRSPPLPVTARPGAADGLTSHHSRTLAHAMGASPDRTRRRT